MSLALLSLGLVFVVLSTFKILFWVGLWQLKEYRRDRFFAHLGTLGKKAVLRCLLWGGRRRPKVTLRSAAVLFLSLSPALLLAAVNPPPKAFFLLLLFWFFVPLLVSTAVFLTAVPVCFVKKAVMGRASSKMRRLSSLMVIGVTGSYGKSTTKEFLTQLLAGKFRVCQTEGTVNTALGVALTILRRLKSGDEVFVVEMGAYKRGEIAEICRMVRPRMGIITGINSQHLELFGGRPALMEAKFELVASLPKDGVAFFNGENVDCRTLAAKTKIKKVFYYSDRVGGYPPTLPRFLKLNFAGAAAVAEGLGMTRRELEKAAKRLKLGRTALRVFSGWGGAEIICDGFSSNPDGFSAALDLLAERGRGKRKVLVTPGIIELGPSSQNIHRRLGRKAGGICREIIVTRKDFYRWIKAGVLAGGQGTLCRLIENPPDVLTVLRKCLDAQTVVLVEGRVWPRVVAELKERKKSEA